MSVLTSLTFAALMSLWSPLSAVRPNHLQATNTLVSSSPTDQDGGTQHDRGGRTASQAEKNVLVVVDMQEDYRGQDKIPEALTEIANMLKDKHKFDQVIYTMDYLDWDGAKFAKPDTHGFEIMKEIKPTGTDHWIFTKDTDDWMNVLDDSPQTHTIGDFTVQTERSFDRKRHFCINPTLDGTDIPVPLPVRLAQAGYLPSNTAIHVVGTQRNRCVMKGCMHAKSFGYQVIVPMLATAGGKLENWKAQPSPHGFENSDFPPSEIRVPKPACKTESGDACSGPVLQRFLKDIYEGYHGGPDLEDVPLYFETAGVEMVDKE